MRTRMPGDGVLLDRLVEVSYRGSPAGRSSGFLLTPEIVLTTAHGLGAAAEALRVRGLDGVHREVSEVLWRDEDLDGLVLRVTTRLPEFGRGAWSFWRPVDRGAIHAARAYGYPRGGALRSASGRKFSETWAVSGRIDGAIGGRHGLLEFGITDGRSAAWQAQNWLGNSGGPVFAGRALIGIVRKADRGTLWARPLSVLMGHPAFAEVFAQHVHPRHLGRSVWGRYLDRELVGPFENGRAAEYVPLDVRVSIADGDAEEPEAAAEAFDREFALDGRRDNDDREHISDCGLVVGEFGSGKTYMLEDLAYRMARRHQSGRTDLVPVLVPLKQVMPPRGLPPEPGRAVDSLFETWLRRRSATYDTPTTLDDPRVVWLLDGADEWVAALAPSVARQYIEALLHPHQLGGRPRIVTSRPETVARLKSRASAWRRVRLDVQALTGDQKEDLVVKKQAAGVTGATSVHALLDRLPGPDQAPLVPGTRYYDLPGITRSPVVLTMMCSIGDRIADLLADDRPVTTSTVYEEYLASAVSRERERASGMCTEGLHADLIESIAIYCAVRGTDVINIRDAAFRRFLVDSSLSFGKRRHTELDEDDLDKLTNFRDQTGTNDPLSRELGESYLLVPSGTHLSFFHRSLMEFLVARRVLRQLDGEISGLVPPRGHDPAGGTSDTMFLLDAQRLTDGTVHFIAEQVEAGSKREALLIELIQRTAARQRSDASTIEPGWLGGNALSVLLLPAVVRPRLQQPLDLSGAVVKGGRFYGRGYDELGHLDLRGAYMVETDAPASIYVRNCISPPEGKSRAKHLRCMALHRDRLLVGLGDGRLGVFRTAQPEPLAHAGTLRGGERYVRSVSTADAGDVSFVVFNDYDTIYATRIEGRRAECTALVDGLKGAVHRIDAIWSQEKLWIAHGAPATGRGDESDCRPVVRLVSWSGESDTPSSRRTLHQHDSSINSVRLHGPTGLLASGADDGIALVSRLAEPDAAPLRLSTADRGEKPYGINEICFSPDGRWLAAVDGGGQLTVWDLSPWLTGELTDAGPTAQAMFSSAPLFSIDWQETEVPTPATRIVVAGRERALHLVDLIDGEGVSLRRTTVPGKDGEPLEVAVPRAHTDNVRCVRLSGEYMYSSGNDGWVHRWPIDVARVSHRKSVRPPRVLDAILPMQPVDLPDWPAPPKPPGA